MVIENILNDIQESGYSVQEDLLSKENIRDLRSSTLDAYHNNSSEVSLKNAGIGRRADLQRNVRGDKIHWLTKEELNPPQKVVWDFLGTLKSHFNQKLFLGLKDFETHITVYPINTFYKKHIDQFKDQAEKSRKISFIIYLNEEWAEIDGGALKLYDPQEHEKVIKTVLPEMGRAVFFLSEDFPHEVLETQKMRVSMTGWFHT